MVRNIRCEETSHLIFSIAGSPPESPSANPPGAGTIGFETEYQVGHYVPPDIFIGVPASLLLRACYPRPCLVLSDISRREPLETAASLYTVAIGHKEADACRTRDSRFVSMSHETRRVRLGAAASPTKAHLGSARARTGFMGTGLSYHRCREGNDLRNGANIIGR